MAAGEARGLDAGALDGVDHRNHRRCCFIGERLARVPEIGDVAELRIRYVDHQHAAGVRVVGHRVRDDLPAARIAHVVGTNDPAQLAQVVKELEAKGER